MTPRQIDRVLEIAFDSSDAELDEVIQTRLFLVPNRGSSSCEVNGVTVLSVFFDDALERENARVALENLDVVLNAFDAERTNWLEKYEQSLEAIEIGERFIVAPDRRLVAVASLRLPIVVPQEQAFGTGSHETTALCMTLLETLDVDGRRGLDVGSGSGILAIAMHLLGARKVIAFDNDTDAYGALRDNRVRNDVPEQSLPIFIGGVEALRGGTFDVITMNIIPEVILPLLSDVVARLAAGGVLILSGILVITSEEVIAAAAAQRLRLTDSRTRGEWWAGTFQMRPVNPETRQ
ncbi:MAG: 50S ribosomal protein L11 methyltransferase [Thermoanaerobaculia bacterium]|nr:50S ribosomal protein L11 methyltransferase [Thermoanaerobaculia bacterium]